MFMSFVATAEYFAYATEITQNVVYSGAKDMREMISDPCARLFMLRSL